MLNQSSFCSVRDKLLPSMKCKVGSESGIPLSQGPLFLLFSLGCNLACDALQMYKHVLSLLYMVAVYMSFCPSDDPWGLPDTTVLFPVMAALLLLAGN